MKDNWPFIVIIFLVCLIEAYLLDGYFKKRYNKEINSTSVYPPNRTDTTILHVNYNLPHYNLPNWKPNIILNYPQSKIDTHIHYILSDSLLKVVDSLKKVTYTYNLAFLSSFSESSKLLASTIKLDSFKIDLLKPEGYVQNQSFHIDLLKYDYFYTYKEGLTFKEKSSLKKPFKKILNLDLLVGYNVLNNTPTISLRPNIEYNRFLMYSEFKTQLIQKPSIFLEVGLGLRLK